MDNSEELDLDSLVDLLDNDVEPFEEEASFNVSPESISKDQPTDSITEVSNKKRLRDRFQESLDPQKVINPDESRVPHDQYMFYKKDSIVHDKEVAFDKNKDGLSAFGTDIKRQMKSMKEREKEDHLSFQRTSHLASTSWQMATKQANMPEKDKNGNSLIVDSFSGIRIVNPLVPFDVMQQRMQDRRMIKMSFIKNFIRNGDIEGDWVTIGVLIRKLPPKETKHGQAFSIWYMSDLHDTEKVVCVFLFKSAHTDHWKTTVGTVLGILNPKIMTDKDSDGNIKMSIDQPAKFMIMGKSKDLGFCKSKKKDGVLCNAPVNLTQCEYCMFHVKKEFKKFSSKRSEVQAAYSGREPSLKDRLLKKQNFIYGGQMFTPAEKKIPGKVKGKDRLTLSNLGLKRKAEAIETEEKEKSVKKLAEMYGPDILKAAQSNSEFINNQLTTPSVGARNLLQHIMKEKTKNGQNEVIISPKELLKMRNSQGINSRPQKSDSVILQNLMPQIGKGLQPGQSFDLNSKWSKGSTIYNHQDLAKLKAIQKIKEKGPLKAKDPNSVKITPEAASKVKAALNNSCEEKKVEEENVKEQSKLGSIDMNSERVKEILNRKSSHAYEVEMAEMEQEAAYFNTLEKKEQMEEKLCSQMEAVCNVISCTKCKYTWHSAAERCIRENHPIKSHKALKRCFVCNDCKKRMYCFRRYPNTTCRFCQGSNFERAPMRAPRSGPKLENENLSIRGDEIGFLQSLQYSRLTPL